MRLCLLIAELPRPYPANSWFLLRQTRAVTKSGTGSWDGVVGRGTRGLEDAGLWDARTSGLGDAWGLEGVGRMDSKS